jgi:hypothetical protein
MKQPEDDRTPDMLDRQRRGRGRPPAGTPPVSDADRAAAYRKRQREKGLVRRYVPDGDG